jgi:hypothetical protein
VTFVYLLTLYVRVCGISDARHTCDDTRSLGRSYCTKPRAQGGVAVVVGPPSPEADWRKPITEYLTILDDETETRRLTCRAKG